MLTVQSADGTTIAYDREGSGPAIVVVGGAMSNRTAVSPMAHLLAPNFTVYAYDRRGRGDSGDTPPYAVAREVEDLAAVIDAAGGSAMVYGHSSGAVLSLLATARGLPITKLAVYEPPFMIDGMRPPPPADLIDRVRAAVAEGRRGDAVVLFMTEAVGVPAPAVEMSRETPMWSGLERVAHTIPYDLSIVGDASIPTAEIAKIDISVLALDGGASPDWARHAVRVLADLLANSQHLSLEGQNHGVDQAVLAPVLLHFFN
jgi:pimeloyl-ACP methyl ester carboxylesterase